MARVELAVCARNGPGPPRSQASTSSIEDGEFVAVLGPSGCGKSTTLLMLAGIYSPTGGDILFDGTRVNDVEARDRNVGIVFQSYALYPHMTVLENVMFPLRFKKVERAEARAAGRARSRRWCGSTRCSTGGRASSRAASSSGWRWPARWSSDRSCCCSTSRFRISTRRCG